MPDFTPLNPKGYIKSGPNATSPPQRPEGAPLPDQESIVTMGNERFSVPELVFNPSDVGQCPVHRLPCYESLNWFRRRFHAGLQQAGLVETVVQVISAMPEDIQGMLWANIGLFGGLASTEGFGERLSVTVSCAPF